MTETETLAVQDSILHWKGLLKMFLANDWVDHNWRWFRAKEPVRCTSEDCPLCQAFSCDECPYTKHYGFTCEDEEEGHYRQFYHSPTQRTCRKMIEALEGILTGG